MTGTAGRTGGGARSGTGVPSGPIVITAGGTGGHMVPADVLADALAARGHRILFVTDRRGLGYPGLFTRHERHAIPAATPGRGGLLAWPKSALAIWAGRQAAAALYRRERPLAVVGFGGYPALPALLAAGSAPLPTIIHEQNAVLGRVNRLLAPRVDAIATSFARTERLPDGASDRTFLVGNPARPAILALGARPFLPPRPGEPLRLLVTGGSQGARVLSEIVPRAVAGLVGAGQPVEVAQQCRAEDLDRVRAAYAEIGIPAYLAAYFEDMDRRLEAAHIVIARAGASTLTELAAAGRPSILVPLPTAADDHQTANAREMEAAGAARVVPQPAFTADRVAAEIRALADPGALAAAAAAARRCARPDAAEALADLVERLARMPGAPARNGGTGGTGGTHSGTAHGGTAGNRTGDGGRKAA